MEWIKVTDRLPTEYKKYLVGSFCDDCISKKQHMHKLIYTGANIEVMRWSAKDMNLVNHYRAKGDSRWDWCAEDHWSENHMDTEKITHWMEFPNMPKEPCPLYESERCNCHLR